MRLPVDRASLTKELALKLKTEDTTPIALW